MSLRDLLIESARRWPSSLAVKDGGRSLTYAELDALANNFALALAELGVRPGDRVGIWLEKSSLAVAAMQGTLRLNAAYVPLDPLNPAARIQSILQDCAVRVVVTTARRTALLQSLEHPSQRGYLQLEDHADGGICRAFAGKPFVMPPVNDHDLAYILYTSGSTGIPKGVCISHANALAFINWAVDALQAVSGDRFANHAPFHFDLSVLDLYAAFAVGAAVVLIPEEIAYFPPRLVNFVKAERPTIWYSVPSVLVLMMEQGGLLACDDLSWRAVLFAGEPFPVKHLRRLSERCPSARLLNLYGPTETNVCTFYEVNREELDHRAALPIGRACSGDQVWAEKEAGIVVQPGEDGELLVTGPTVMQGYWGQERHGDRPYATGDLVRLLADGNYLYLGRKDQMIKIRGYRMEPGDIEAALLEHPAIREAAVLVHGTGIGARLVAFIACSGREVPALLDLKRHCARRLPRPMIVDTLRVLPALPRTRNGKIDRLALAEDYAEMEKENERCSAQK